MTLDVNITHHDLIISVFEDNHVELPETITISLEAHVANHSVTTCTFISYYELESRIILDLPKTTVTIIDPGVIHAD